MDDKLLQIQNKLDQGYKIKTAIYRLNIFQINDYQSHIRETLIIDYNEGEVSDD